MEIKFDDSIVMLGESGPGFPPFESLVHVYVKDVDTTFEKALAAGGASVERPKSKPNDPDKRGSEKDPCGNTWAIGTQH